VRPLKIVEKQDEGKRNIGLNDRRNCIDSISTGYEGKGSIVVTRCASKNKRRFIFL
jgi:hypothetical protein